VKVFNRCCSSVNICCGDKSRRTNQILCNFIGTGVYDSLHKYRVRRKSAFNRKCAEEEGLVVNFQGIFFFTAV
jgi:hypothetical protein